jgi:ArsR family transcriptional regulator
MQHDSCDNYLDIYRLMIDSSFVKNSQLQDVAALTRALGNEHRLRILVLLMQAPELCTSQIIEVFNLANSTISKHLAILRQTGLVQSRKDERRVFYFLPVQSLPEIQATLAWSGKLLSADQTRIQSILQIDPVELCRRQSGRDGC